MVVVRKGRREEKLCHEIREGDWVFYIELGDWSDIELEFQNNRSFHLNKLTI